MPVVELRSAEEVFVAAMKLRESGGPSSISDTWLGDLCANDTALLEEVKSLLSHLDDAGSDDIDSGFAFLDPAELHGPRAVTLRRDAELEEWGGAAVGQRVGDFVIIGKLASGGMGIVYVAEQQRPRRTVALKVIRREIATPGMVARFEREAELLGRLSHPGIAQIYAAGVADVSTVDRGRIRIPYIAMERVDGIGVLEHVGAPGRTREEIVKLVIQMCDAIQHAHQRGVIHRDLKPANVLVAAEDGAARVKVLDFGVARAVGSKLTDESMTPLTGHGHMIGTPAYMSPEQISGQGNNVGAASDVYGIGAMLFRLLTGRHAIDLDGCPLPEIARRVVERVPPRIGTIDRSLRGDLETIVAKTLEKDPARRYASAAELSQDLRNYLEGRLIGARREGWVDTYLKIVAQHWVALTCVAIAAIIFFVFGWYASAYIRPKFAP